MFIIDYGLRTALRARHREERMGSTNPAALVFRGLFVFVLGACFAFILASEAGANPQSSSRDQSEYARGLEASGIEPDSRAPSEKRPHAVCPPPTTIRATCLSAVVPERLAD